MRNLFRRGFALLLAAVMALGCSTAALAADGTAAVTYSVTYGQSEARKMLDMVNSFRTGGDAWYWNEDNTEKSYATGLQNLTWDYQLEQDAMQRAAEIALSFSHTRPDGTLCFTVDGLIYGENIAYGNSTAQGTFTQWLEENNKYSGQGHRRNILGSFYTGIGIACVRYNGTSYWVMELGKTSGAAAAAANDSETAVTVNASADQFRSITAKASSEGVSVGVGSTIAVPTVSLTLGRSGALTAGADWTVADTSVARLEGGQLRGVKVGTTSMTATVMGKTVTADIEVTPVSLSDGTISVSPDTVTYTGKALTPSVTVTVNGAILTQGTDYTLSYENNVNAGTATVTASGTGSYTGTLSGTFTISPCAHQWDNGRVTAAATCAAEGTMTYTCTLCSETKTEPIEALPHTPATDEAKAPTCTDTGLTQGSHCSVCNAVLTAQETVPATGHSFGAWETKTAPDCVSKGSQQRSCSVCGATESQELNPLGHSWDEGRVTAAATCAAEGTMTFTCTLCGATKTEPIEALPHTPVTDEAKAPTCTGTGLTQGSHCSVCDAVLTAQETVPATGHSFGAWETKTAPDCVSKGSQQRSCSVCGATESQELKALGHSFVWVTDKEATATEAGSRHEVCSLCGETGSTEVLPATGTDSKPDTGADTKPDTGTDTGSDAKPDTGTDTKTDAKADTKADSTVNSKTSAVSDTKTDTAKTDAGTAVSGSKVSPKTGDTVQPILWVIGLTGAAAALTALVITGKKKKA